MKIELTLSTLIFVVSSIAYAEKKETWCCVAEDQVVTFSSSGKEKNLCLKSAGEPKKSSYVKKCKKLEGKWVKQQKKK